MVLDSHTSKIYEILSTARIPKIIGESHRNPLQALVKSDKIRCSYKDNRKETTLPMKVIELKESILENNDQDAQVLRDELKAKKICLVNLMSSPGSGKTPRSGTYSVPEAARVQNGIFLPMPVARKQMIVCYLRNLLALYKMQADMVSGWRISNCRAPL